MYTHQPCVAHFCVLVAMSGRQARGRRCALAVTAATSVIIFAEDLLGVGQTRMVRLFLLKCTCGCVVYCTVSFLLKKHLCVFVLYLFCVLVLASQISSQRNVPEVALLVVSACQLSCAIPGSVRSCVGVFCLSRSLRFSEIVGRCGILVRRHWTMAGVEVRSCGRHRCPH